MRGSAVRRASAGASTIAAARVAASFALKRELPRKAICPGPARSSEPTCRIRTFGSPATRPPRREAISPSLRERLPCPGMRSFRGRLAAFQRLDHLVGDVDAGVRPHGILQDDVVLLLLGNLADHPVGLLDHLGKLLVAPLVQILADFALPALEIAVQIAEFALLVAALGLAHGHRVLLQLVLHALELIGDLGELLVALLELGLDLLLRPHGGRGVAQDALGVDEADPARRLGLGEGPRRRSAARRDRTSAPARRPGRRPRTRRGAATVPSRRPASGTGTPRCR